MNERGTETGMGPGKGEFTKRWPFGALGEGIYKMLVTFSFFLFLQFLYMMVSGNGVYFILFFTSYEYSKFDVGFPNALTTFLGADLTKPSCRRRPDTHRRSDYYRRTTLGAGTGYHKWVFSRDNCHPVGYVAYFCRSRGLAFVVWFDIATCPSGMFHLMTAVGVGLRVMFYDCCIDCEKFRQINTASDTLAKVDVLYILIEIVFVSCGQSEN